MTDPKRLKEALEVALGLIDGEVSRSRRLHAIGYADTTDKRRSEIKSFLSTFDEREAFIAAARRACVDISSGDFDVQTQREMLVKHRELVAAEQASTEPRKGDGDVVEQTHVLSSGAQLAAQHSLQSDIQKSLVSAVPTVDQAPNHAAAEQLSVAEWTCAECGYSGEPVISLAELAFLDAAKALGNQVGYNGWHLGAPTVERFMETYYSMLQVKKP